MTLEEVLGIEIPTADAEQFGSPREMVDWLEDHLRSYRPSIQTAALLRGIAKSRGDPKLAEGLESGILRKQIAAIISEMFRDL
jgi:hypothetical protein